MRHAAGLLLLLCAGFASGCALVVTTAVVAGTVAGAAVSTAGKVATTTVKTTGRVVSAAVSSSGEVAALSMESAAKLAKAGMVVAVDAGSGGITEFPWREGMRLGTAARSGEIGPAFKLAKIFRNGRVFQADLQRARSGIEDHALLFGDVLELRR